MRAVLALALVVAVIYSLGDAGRPAASGSSGGDGAGTGPGRCVAELRSFDGWSRAQLRNATRIAETAVAMDMDPLKQAVVVGLATAMQESKLRNLPHQGARNDHDSLGLFQQRSNWGTAEERRTPRIAAKRFFRALRRVHGWKDMRVTDAAQQVQNSAYPEAYQQWADDAAQLARRLLKNC
jgi:hypothetical protein